MTDESASAARAETETMASNLPGLLEGLVEKLGASAGAAAVFGDPVQKGERTVIPVAQSIVGTGAGGGGVVDSPDSGVGAGGGALTRPLGYLEITPDAARFVPLRRPWADAKLVLAYSLLALVVSRMVVKLVRG